MVDGQSLYDYYDDDYIDHEGAFTLEFNYGAPCAVNSCNAEAHEYCLPTGFGDNDYECACDEENGYFELNGSCVNPCENGSVCPDETANGTNSCTPSSATEFTCGCQAGYFETVQDGIHSCTDPCSLPTAPDCSAEGTNVVCKSTSLTNIFCACETGYYDMDSEDTFNCILAGPQGADICSVDAPVIEVPSDYSEAEWSGIYMGDTTNATNNQTKNGGNDYTYILRLTKPAIAEIWMETDSITGYDTTVYMKSECSGTTTSFYNDTSTAHLPGSKNSSFVTTMLNPGDYYVIVDAWSTTAKGPYALHVNLELFDDICLTNPCSGVENSSCFQVGDSDYECRCNATDGYYDADDTEGVNCVNPCLEPEAPVCGDHSVCKSTSATAASCVCETGYFLSGETCVSPCETNPCLGVENSTEVCTATSTTVYSCGCEEGSLFLIDNGVPSCVIIGPSGSNTCTNDADVPLIEDSGIWVGTTVGATNNYGTASTCTENENEQGNDVVYKLTLNAGDSITAKLTKTGGTASWIILYLLTSCEMTSCVAPGRDTELSPFTLTYTNSTSSTMTYYLVVDAWQLGNTLDYRLDVNFTRFTDYCTENPCLGVANSDGVCTQSTPDTYTCGCEAGYYANNTLHTCTSPCEPNPCEGIENSTEVCTATSSTVFTCACVDGAIYKVINGNPACVLSGPTGTDTCVDSPVINSSGLWVGTSVGSTNNYNPGSGGCTGYKAEGVDVAYQITMSAGDQLNLSLKRISTSVDMSLYIVTDCSNIVSSCIKGVDGGDPEVLTYTAGSDATYYIIIDAYSSTDGYNYELTVNYTPTEPDPCGDGVIDSDNNEECDPAAVDVFDGLTCVDYGFSSGDLVCNTTCQIKTASCVE